MLAEQERRRKPRRDRGPRLTPRDPVMLRWMGEQYALRFDQIQRLLARFSTGALLTPGRVSESTARPTIDRWEMAGLVVSKKILADEQGYCWVTLAVRRPVGQDFLTLLDTNQETLLPLYHQEGHWSGRQHGGAGRGGWWETIERAAEQWRKLGRPALSAYVVWDEQQERCMLVCEHRAFPL
jgi:hypothetical protein